MRETTWIFLRVRENVLHIITYTFQLNGTLPSLWLRDSPHDKSVHIAGKSHVFARAAKEPTGYENVPICFFGYFLLLEGRY